MIKVSSNNSRIIGGLILSIIGGLLSILLGFLIPDVFSGISSQMGESIIILQGITIAGGIITLIGAMVVLSIPKMGGIIILIGGFVAGLNILTIIGAASIFKKTRKKLAVNEEQAQLPVQKTITFSQLREEISSSKEKPKRTTDSQPQRFKPISEILKQTYNSKPITDAPQLKKEELQRDISSLDKKEENTKGSSYICKSCGKELIEKTDFCPHCGKIINNK